MSPKADSTDVAQRTRPAASAGRDKHKLVRRFRLTVVEGTDVGKSFTSSTPRAVIGSDEGADFTLTDPTVSRFHCQIEIREGKAVLRDNGSLNGTAIDGVSIVEARLTSRAVLELGDTKLRFDIGAEHVQVPLSQRDSFGLLVGESTPMREMFSALERATESDATVLLLGETGTGKGLTAESIHAESSRRDQPFVMVQCGALPRELMESELFGHTKGAFTGAVGERDGAFQAASGGTLFLDEIGELAPDLQPKLLHAIEARQVKRVGSNEYADVDVRLVAATNRNLKAEVNNGNFRSDLYYRVAVIELTLPPLRDRAEDIPELVRVLLERTNIRYDPEAAASVVNPEFFRDLARHSWPGNIRELRNYLERCMALRAAVPLEPAEAGGSDGLSVVDSTKPLRDAREAWQAACERKYLTEILERHKGNVSAAARFAKVDRSNFYRLLWKHGLR